MGRPVILSNGALLVGLNEQGLVHDFYYPYIGLDNLTTARSTHHLIGVWVEGIFSWVDDGNWEITTNFETEALISDLHMVNHGLGIGLVFKDFIDNEFNVFCRSISVTNNASSPRDIRVFMHQVFEISRAGRADTALFEPEEHYILDYKGRCSLLIFGQHTGGETFDQFAIGNYGIEGKEGTYRDAEDGELSGSAVEHGGVDSVMRFSCPLDAGKSAQLEYWIIAADSQFTAEKIHHIVKTEGLAARLASTRAYWHNWLSVAKAGLENIDAQYVEATKKSLLIIKSHIDKRGGIVASCDSSIYNYGKDYYSYVWPRDGAYVIWPLIRLGYTHEPRRFFEFCRDILTDDGYLMHKYQPDRAIGSTWHPLLHGKHKELAIQEDETASVIYMLGEYYHYSKDQDFVRSLYSTLVQPAANFMEFFIDEQTKLPHASYDLWEEKFLTNTYTASVVYQALLTAAEFADLFDYPDDGVRWRDVAGDILVGSQAFFDPLRKAYRKGFLLNPEDASLAFDNTLDVSSLYGVMMYGMHGTDTTELSDTLELIEKTLLNQSPSGGSPRYEHDGYFQAAIPYMGNPWSVTTLWIAQYYIKTKRLPEAEALLKWALDHALPSGVMSEQVNPTDGQPVSVTPLIWSHAELINTVIDISRQ